MVVETTYYDKETKQIIEDLVGPNFSFIQKLKMNGVGSKRMMISEVSPNMKHLLNTVSDINYANIELRPKGILIYITKGLKNFTWVIPYYQLVLYKTNGSSIHAQGRFIQFKDNMTFKENKKFFGKLLDEKVKYDLAFNMPSKL